MPTQPVLTGQFLSSSGNPAFTYGGHGRLGNHDSFQSGLFDAVHEPERLAGRLAPSVSVREQTLPHRVVRPDIRLWRQPIKPVFRPVAAVSPKGGS